MMNTLVIKFGGSSVADNLKLNIVAEKIISLKNEAKNIVVVVSAQGKKTNKLTKEALELAKVPNEREMDLLLSTGEQVSAAKLSILLNEKGYEAIALTGWQAGIITNGIHGNAKIKQINTRKINYELEQGKIVIVTGFQGASPHNHITTLGRGGSDTTAVALGAALKADKCYIYSDVDGIYSADPDLVINAKKLSTISFKEMQEIADAGAKVLHNRCIEIGQKFNTNIVTKSTFHNGNGTKILKEIENTEIKSIIKNENLVEVIVNTKDNSNEIYKNLLKNNITIEAYRKNKNIIKFRILKSSLKKADKVLKNLKTEFKNIVKLSIVGYGIGGNNDIIDKVITILNNHHIKIKEINLSQVKLEILVDEIHNDIVRKLHKKIIN